MSEGTLAATFTAVAVKRMRLSEETINRCVDQLTDEQIWQRGAEYENSVANLLMHLGGNIRQWILHGIDRQPDIRQRDAEFALEAAVPVAEIRARFAETLNQACQVIIAVPEERLLEMVDPQPGGGWGAVTVVEVILLIAGHLQLHTGQIILLTKQMLGRDLDLSLPRRR